MKIKMKNYSEFFPTRRSSIPYRNAFVLLLMVGLVGCASQGHRLNPQTGDISFRLEWQGEADLDLHVRDPHGTETGVSGSQTVSSPEAALAAIRKQMEQEQEQGPRGILDVDCNASPSALCPDPIENIYWAEGTASNGSYEVWVDLFNPIPDPEGEVAYAVHVRRGKRVVKTFDGVLSNEVRSSQRFSFTY